MAYGFNNDKSKYEISEGGGGGSSEWISIEASDDERIASGGFIKYRTNSDGSVDLMGKFTFASAVSAGSSVTLTDTVPEAIAPQAAPTGIGVKYEAPICTDAGTNVNVIVSAQSGFSLIGCRVVNAVSADENLLINIHYNPKF